MQYNTPCAVCQAFFAKNNTFFADYTDILYDKPSIYLIFAQCGDIIPKNYYFLLEEQK
jgi:hypothetical protein